MKFKWTLGKDKSRQYELERKINMADFFSIMNLIANSFGEKLEIDSIPEAEIAVIKFSIGRIYAKYDLAYGFEIECLNLTGSQVNKFEEILLGF
jgi:hypothetical protein